MTLFVDDHLSLDFPAPVYRSGDFYSAANAEQRSNQKGFGQSTVMLHSPGQVLNVSLHRMHLRIWLL